MYRMLCIIFRYQPTERNRSTVFWSILSHQLSLVLYHFSKLQFYLEIDFKWVEVTDRILYYMKSKLTSKSRLIFLVAVSA